MAAIMNAPRPEDSRYMIQRQERAQKLSKYIEGMVTTPEGSGSRMQSDYKSPSEAEQKEDQLYWALAEAKMLDDKTPEVFEADLNDSEVLLP